MMLTFCLFISTLFICTLLFFEIVQRLLFIIYNNKVSNLERLTMKDIWQIYRHGFRSDVIIGSYVVAIPIITYLLVASFSMQIYIYFLYFYFAIIAIAIGLGSVADTALYKFWRYKLDRSALTYLKSLKGAFASVTTTYLILAFASVALISIIVFVFECISLTVLPQAMDVSIISLLLSFLVLIIMAGLVFIGIRGLGRRPNNPSLVFYSKNLFYNHCALNPIYNFIYSLSVKNSFRDVFHFYDDEECNKMVRPMFPTSGKPQTQLLNTSQPNILLVVWESLCARFIESLGGQKGVMPQMERLINEGVLFTRVDSGSFRTDRGLVCLLSGYLGQPTESIIRMSKKLPNLPALPRRFRDLGYETTALHGGDLTIFHKADYYLTMGHDRLVAQSDLPSTMPTGKWGVHDGATMDWLFDDIMEKTKRGKHWFTTYQTLSSHEDFKVPYNLLPDDEIANSYAYVDDCFGKFIDRLKGSPDWNDMLVIVVGDHGCNSGVPLERDKYPHIPLLMLGGAIKEPCKIDTIMGQYDLAATLLGQLGMDHDEFTFSRDVLADTYTYPFSFHTYNNGFLFRDGDGCLVYDNDAKAILKGDNPEYEKKGKAILQYLYNDLDKR